MYLGKRVFLKDSLEVAENYLEISLKDEKAADILRKSKIYNQAAYFYIQAMEKRIKAQIARKIDITKEYFAKELSKTMGHSLERSLELLIQIYTGRDIVLAQQMKNQLMKVILKDVRFTTLHNGTRYPFFNEEKENYTMLNLEEKDCEELKSMLHALEKYLKDIG
jgi:hypothetical protein